jgi:hypothetical protein
MRLASTKQPIGSRAGSCVRPFFDLPTHLIGSSRGAWITTLIARPQDTPRHRMSQLRPLLPNAHRAVDARAATYRLNWLFACTAAIASTLMPPGALARADTEHAPHISIEDPRLLPFVPVLEQCLERRGQYPTATEFLQTEYGVACAAVMLSFQLVTRDELAEAWTR